MKKEGEGMNTPIYETLKKHMEKGYSSFHTPGHKSSGFFPHDLLRYDLTELPDTDALYEASGVISKSEELLAKLFGAKKSLISAGGCTLAIQTMLMLAAKKGRKMLFARNSHRSAVLACALIGIEPLWLMPKDGGGFGGRVRSEDVEAALCKDPDISAVYLTSPNYYGEISDIGTIAEICHAHHALLLIDNAHGSHLAFLKEKLHPIRLGADMSACSLHKTLPVLTGGAALNIANEEMTVGAKEAMSVFGSTSPSYLVMSSIDLCREYLETAGADAYRRTEQTVSELKSMIRDAGLSQPTGCCDPLRICFCTSDSGIEGVDSQTAFFHRYGIEPEFCDGKNVVLICTPFNTEQDFSRVREAVEALGRNARTDECNSDVAENVLWMPRALMMPRKALFLPTETVPLQSALGRICAEIACPCPPGIPVIMPGEEIDKNVISLLLQDGRERVRVVLPDGLSEPDIKTTKNLSNNTLFSKF